MLYDFLNIKVVRYKENSAVWSVLVGSVVVILIAAFVVTRGRYYRRMFSDGNFREFHARLSQAIEKAMVKNQNQDPSLEDGTAFLTDAGLAISVTFNPDDDEVYALHVSISQPSGPTTHSVCSRFGFFIVAMLWDNKSEVVPFFTKSGVHHLRFEFQSQDVTLLDFEKSFSHYLNEYRPVPFQCLELGSELSAPADGRD